MSRQEAINKKVLELLGRFDSVDVSALMAEISQVDAKAILQSGVLVDSKGVVRLGQVGVMEALLTLALGGKPTIALPKSMAPVRNALILFLKLNNTDTFGYGAEDTPGKWAFRILDMLFLRFAETNTLTIRDRLVLLRVSENPVWQAAFTTALQLYLQLEKGGTDFIRKVDNPAVGAAGKAFKSAVEIRRARIPKVKYGNPLAGFKEITEYSIGQYFEGADLNDAMSQALVQAQLGTAGDEGKVRFARFLAENRITPDMFPTTVSQLYSVVGQAIQFQPTEEETSLTLYAFAKTQGQQKQIERVFANFAEPAFSVAAKLARLMSFEGLDAGDAAGLITRWMRETRALRDIRHTDLKLHVQAVVEGMPADEMSHFSAFRQGRTLSGNIADKELQSYVETRCRLLTLNAVNRKMRRVEETVGEQMKAAEMFVNRPGKQVLKDMTFGMEDFFRTLQGVFRDIFEASDKTRQMQVQQLDAFTKKYGPLSTVSLLTPREPDMPTGKWIEQSRKKLNTVPAHFFGTLTAGT
ncbi:hypothetical protein F1188_10880 [Roseospira marina]|uniref:Uncharacterized protein n=1 Tax=Roseospira marina TaxID=140057 RepID=A0A5M6IAU5_9PROT|nr:hypothetical protein [Roseospira marina]KAA5605400.1 hypothetical protein F1188_10880 [Roseospira marina]MBB4314613.1 hypothetical protein [Roseospira marina]MBB5088782.1 hypothetical protein [Roseospira marina]